MVLSLNMKFHCLFISEDILIESGKTVIFGPSISNLTSDMLDDLIDSFDYDDGSRLVVVYVNVLFTWLTYDMLEHLFRLSILIF
jgi:hypothetical protein